MEHKRNMPTEQTLAIATTGEKILTQVARQVTEFDQPLHDLSHNMLNTMLAAHGVGIAAPQVFSDLALFIMASQPNERYPDAPKMQPVTVVNPQILSASTEMVAGVEGCLSIPQKRITILRHQAIEVRYQDLHANWHQQQLSGFIARIFQHEFDHLQGITLLERSALQPHLAIEE